MRGSMSMTEQKPKDARAQRFALTDKPPTAPKKDDQAAELAAARKPCPSGGKVVRSGAFDSLDEAVKAKK
jgi:hypothetical protein